MASNNAKSIILNIPLGQGPVLLEIHQRAWFSVATCDFFVPGFLSLCWQFDLVQFDSWAVGGCGGLYLEIWTLETPNIIPI